MQARRKNTSDRAARGMAEARKQGKDPRLEFAWYRRFHGRNDEHVIFPSRCTIRKCTDAEDLVEVQCLPRR